MLISPHEEDRCASFHHWPLGASGSLVPEGAVTHTSQGPVVIKLSPSGGDQHALGLGSNPASATLTDGATWQR